MAMDLFYLLKQLTQNIANDPYCTAILIFAMVSIVFIF
jgi:hypothetical protein